MTKSQKIDKLLECVAKLIELTTFDDFISHDKQQSGHYMSDATFEALADVHTAYRDIDFFNYETLITRGIAAGSESLKGETNETN